MPLVPSSITREEGLAKLEELARRRRDLDAMQATVIRALQGRASWTWEYTTWRQIGKALGVSPQGAQQWYRRNGHLAE